MRDNHLLDGRLPDSRLPEDDDPWVWVDDRKLVVSSSWGLTPPGDRVGVHINALPDEPIAGEFEFHFELGEVDAEGARRRVLEEHAVRTAIPTDQTDLFETHLPMTASAFYRIAVRVTRQAFDETVRTYITVPPAILEAKLVPSRTRARPGEALRFTIVNAGPTPLFLGEAYNLERRVDGGWVRCNDEGMWRLIGLSIPPGRQRDEEAAIPKNTPPGRYRVTKDLHATGTNLSRSESFEFEVADDAS